MENSNTNKHGDYRVIIVTRENGKVTFFIQKPCKLLKGRWLTWDSEWERWRLFLWAAEGYYTISEAQEDLKTIYYSEHQKIKKIEVVK